jgi:MFS family permease
MEKTVIEMKDVDFTTMKFKTDGKNTKTMETKSKNDEIREDQLNDMILVTKLDNVFMSIKNKPNYFYRLKMLLLATIILFYSLLWFLFDMVSEPKNNIYCRDDLTQEFNICDLEDYCSDYTKGVVNFIFLDNSTYGHPDTLTEEKILNDQFKNYFLQDYIVFSFSNYNKISRFEEILKRFNIIAIISTNENWNLFFTFKQVCQRKEVLLEFSVFLFLGYSVGNIFVMFIADLYGRKKVVMQNSLCCGICSIGIGVFTIVLLNKSKLEINSSGFDLPSDFIIYKELYKNYKDNFSRIQSMIQEGQIIAYYFSKYKMILYLLLFLIGINLSSSVSVCNAYILENSLNDNDIYYNYNFQNYGLIISYVANYFLVLVFDNFYYPFIIIGSLQIILSFLIQFTLLESPRHQYEFHEYDQITSFFKKIEAHEVIKFFVNKNDDRIKVELIKNQFANEESTILGTIKILCNRRNKFTSTHLDFSEIYRTDILSNPFFMYKLMFKNKHVKKHFLVICSLILNIAFIYSLVVLNFNKAFVVSKEEMYKSINLYVFIIAIILFVSQNFFYFLMKFFGYNIILFICFFFIFIFSILFEINDRGIRDARDLNKYFFNSQTIVYNEYKDYNFSIFCVICFFSYGLNFTMFLYLTKYTKTIYRCCFYGLCQIVTDFTMIFTLGINEYFDKCMYYTCIASLIGFVNAYFVNQDFDESIICDFRKLELEKRRKSRFLTINDNGD